MKKLLFFLFTILTLSSCVDDKLSFIKQGKIEKCENETSVSVDGVVYSVLETRDYLSKDFFEIGDMVNIYSDGQKMIVSKSDVTLAEKLDEEFNMSRCWSDWVTVLFFVLITFCLGLALLWVILSIVAFTSNEKSKIFLRKVLMYIADVKSIDDPGIHLLKFGVRFALFSCFVFAFGVWLSFDAVKYKGEVVVDDFTRKTITLQGVAFPSDNVVLSQFLILPQDTCLMYQQNDKLYLYKKSTTPSSLKPEMAAELVNQKAQRMALFYFCLWGGIWTLSILPFYKRVFRYVYRRIFKSHNMKDHIDVSGGHGSFVKK